MTPAEASALGLPGTSVVGAPFSRSRARFVPHLNVDEGMIAMAEGKMVYVMKEMVEAAGLMGKKAWTNIIEMKNDVLSICWVDSVLKLVLKHDYIDLISDCFKRFNERANNARYQETSRKNYRTNVLIPTLFRSGTLKFHVTFLFEFFHYIFFLAWR